jgi:hypothetical protein
MLYRLFLSRSSPPRVVAVWNLLLVDDPVSDSGAPVAASVFTNHNTGRCDSDDGGQRVQ